jgi:hypothetical protein
MWYGYSRAVGGRKAGRAGVGLLSIKRDAVAAYLAGLAERGHDLGLARLAGGVNMIIADDPEVTYERIRPHYLYQVNSHLVAAGRSVLNEGDLGDRLGRGRREVIVDVLTLTCDGAIAELRLRLDQLPVQHIYTWATIAQMPADLFGRHIELWLGPVRAALADRISGPEYTQKGKEIQRGSG